MGGCCPDVFWRGRLPSAGRTSRGGFPPLRKMPRQDGARGICGGSRVADWELWLVERGRTKVRGIPGHLRWGQLPPAVGPTAFGHLPLSKLLPITIPNPNAIGLGLRVAFDNMRLKTNIIPVPSISALNALLTAKPEFSRLNPEPEGVPWIAVTF